jgi:hypothetical protein
VSSQFDCVRRKRIFAGPPASAIDRKFKTNRCAASDSPHSQYQGRHHFSRIFSWRASELTARLDIYQRSEGSILLNSSSTRAPSATPGNNGLGVESATILEPRSGSVARKAMDVILQVTSKASIGTAKHPERKNASPKNIQPIMAIGSHNNLLRYVLTLRYAV